MPVNPVNSVLAIDRPARFRHFRSGHTLILLGQNGRYDMPYPDLMTAPMRRELTSAGFVELRTAAEVDAFMDRAKDGSAMVVVNSICGCASGCMRPAVVRVVAGEERPVHLGTVFAGQDIEATERARQYFADHPPSSPAVALFRQGSLAFMLERHRIQGRHPQMIAEELESALRELGHTESHR